MKTDSNLFSILVHLVCVSIILSSLLVLSDDGFSQQGRLTGKIQNPANDSRVSRKFPVEGTISSGHRKVWLVERVGSLHWPKAPELKPQNGRWVGEVNEGGQPPNGRFEILLMEVSPNTSQQIENWLRIGKYDGLGIEFFGDGQILDRKTFLLN